MCMRFCIPDEAVGTYWSEVPLERSCVFALFGVLFRFAGRNEGTITWLALCVVPQYFCVWAHRFHILGQSIICSFDQYSEGAGGHVKLVPSSRDRGFIQTGMAAHSVLVCVCLLACMCWLCCSWGSGVTGPGNDISHGFVRVRYGISTAHICFEKIQSRIRTLGGSHSLCIPAWSYDEFWLGVWYRVYMSQEIKIQSRSSSASVCIVCCDWSILMMFAHWPVRISYGRRSVTGRNTPARYFYVSNGYILLSSVTYYAHLHAYQKGNVALQRAVLWLESWVLLLWFTILWMARTILDWCVPLDGTRPDLFLLSYPEYCVMYWWDHSVFVCAISCPVAEILKWLKSEGMICTCSSVWHFVDILWFTVRIYSPRT